MRGMGENANMVAQGFGPPPAVEVIIKAETVPDLPRGRRRDKPLYEELAKSLWVESYRIQAKLHSINGEKVINSKDNKFLLENDTRESFSVRPAEKARVRKTIAKDNIFIKVLKLYKRR
jgi:hypothetical protein